MYVFLKLYGTTLIIQPRGFYQEIVQSHLFSTYYFISFRSTVLFYSTAQMQIKNIACERRERMPHVNMRLAFSPPPPADPARRAKCWVGDNYQLDKVSVVVECSPVDTCCRTAGLCGIVLKSHLSNTEFIYHQLREKHDQTTMYRVHPHC